MRKIIATADSFSIPIPKSIWRAAVTKFGGENDGQEEEHDDVDNLSESDADEACGLPIDDPIDDDDKGGAEDLISDEEQEQEDEVHIEREDGAGTSESVVRRCVLNLCESEESIECTFVDIYSQPSIILTSVCLPQSRRSIFTT